MQVLHSYWQRFGKKVVIGEGNPATKHWIIGEALGEQEERYGVPFYPEAPAGRLLRGVLKQAKLNEGGLFITNIYPIRPPGNRVERLREYGVNLEEAKEVFKAFLKRYLPRRVVALGNIAMEALTEKKGIEEWRGSPFLLKDGTWLVPSLHPSAIQRKFDNQAKKEDSSKYTYGSGRMSLLVDLVKAFEWPNLEPPRVKVHTEYSLEVAINMLAEWTEKKEPLAFDIETLGTYIDLIGFASSSEEAWVYPMKRASWGSFWYLFDKALRNLLSTHPKLIGQNAAFDTVMLRKSEYDVAPIWFDTRLAHSWLYPELPGDLHYMVSLYTTHPHYKWMIATERMKYNGLDCALTFKVYEELEERIYKMEGE